MRFQALPALSSESGIAPGISMDLRPGSTAGNASTRCMVCALRCASFWYSSALPRFQAISLPTTYA